MDTHLNHRRRFGRGIVALLVSAYAVLTASGMALPAHAQGSTAEGLLVSVGYADSLRASTNLPVPWRGSPNTIFIGSAAPWDAGAIRLDNPTPNAIAVTSVIVNVHGHVFNLWGSFTVPAGKSAILTQTAQYNFDTSDFPLTSCGVPATSNAPTIAISVAGALSSTLIDSAHILDTFGYDSICRVANESLAWRPIGAVGGISAALSLTPPAATKMLGTPDTSTATLTDAAGHPLPNVLVDFRVTAGPNAGKTGQGFTDNSGHATFTYTSAHMGTDTIVASVSNASGGSFSSNAVKVTWLHSSTLVSTPKLILIPEGGKISLSATLTEDGTTPIVGRKVTETLGSGSASQSCTGVTDATGTATCSISPVTVPLGPQPITDSFTSDGSYASQTHDQHGLVFAYLGRGSFVVGDRSDAVGSSVNWWGSQWAGRNSLSGGSAPDSFKGFADSLSSTPPACGGSWTSDPGNSGRPPATVPSYMAVISAGSIRKSGSTISGNVMHIVIVKTDVGYADDPGHAGTGTVIAQLCP